jgi:putative ABC transport system permease protein
MIDNDVRTAVAGMNVPMKAQGTIARSFIHAILLAMWGVTFADLAYRYRQFLIAIVGAGVVLAMSLLLAGLAGGFSAEINRTVGAVGAQGWVLSSNANSRITAVSVFPQSDTLLIAHSPGVTRADPMAIIPGQVARINGSNKTVMVFGVQIGGLGDPAVASGQALSGSGQVVADTRAGAGVGDRITVGSMHFTVVGRVHNRTLLGGTPIVYMTLPDTQALALGGRPMVTAVVTRGSPSRAPAGLTVLSNHAVEQSTLQALSSGVKSINNSKIFMWIVAAIIIGALLYVSALQRVRDFAILKALGSSSLLLFGSLALQAVTVTLLAAAFALIISNFMGGMFAQPVDIPASAYATLPIVAVVVGLLSSLVALRRATGADPAAAFGG